MEVAAPARARGRWRDALEERRFLAGVLIAPAVLFIAVLVLAPLLLAIYLSLTDATAGSLSGDFVGLRNYTEAWDSPNFRRALRNTVIFTVVSQIVVLLVAGVLAHQLAKPFRGRWILRFFVLLPWAAPIALGTIGFLWIFDSLFSVVNWTLVHDVFPGPPEFKPYKVINWLFARPGLPDWLEIKPIDPFAPPQWLGQPTLAMAAIIFVHTWRIIPFATVIFLAGLASIPAEVEDAAKVDGTAPSPKFWYVKFINNPRKQTLSLLSNLIFNGNDTTID